MRLFGTVVVIIVAVSALTSQSAINLPFKDQFDPNAKGDWEYGGLHPWVVSDPAKVGNYALYSPDNASLAVGVDQLWFSTWTIMNPVDIGEENSVTNITPADAAAFFMDTDGAVHAFSNDTYVVVANLGASATNDWHKFAVQLDYDVEKWNLYHKGSSANDSDPFNRLHEVPLLFNTDFDPGAPSPAIYATGETYIDDVLVTRGLPIGDSTPAYAAEVTMALSSVGTGFALEYFSDGEGTLRCGFGDVLAPLLNAGAELHVWTNTNFGIVDLDGEGWGAVDKAVLNQVITPTTGFFLQGVTWESVDPVVMLAYDALTIPSTAIVTGWNLLAVPHSVGATSLADLGLPAGTHDLVFVWTESGWGISRYNGSSWTENLQIPAGRTFWLRSRSEGTWNP